MIKLTKEQRGLLLKEVHCTKYLKQKKCDYYLKLSELTDYWYYSNYNDNNKETYFKYLHNKILKTSTFHLLPPT